MGAIVILAIGVVFVQRLLDPQIREIHKGENTKITGLSNEFILGPMLGLQQAVAGMLWVRADEFFHEGDYDAILPIVRMVTWLDPHQLDVYITGAWHLAYNFTDSSERSDRRYIPASQKLLEEGDGNNQLVYDIAFELGWQNNDKIKDYDRAAYWFAQAKERKAPDDYGQPEEEAPMFVTHMLAHARERQGLIDDCIQVWKDAIGRSTKKVEKTPEDYTAKNVLASEIHNRDINLKRKYSRFVHEIAFEVDSKMTRSIDLNTGEPSPRDAYLSTDPVHDGVPLGSPRLPATKKPWDTAFDVKSVKFPEPKVLDIKGDFNVGDGARVTVRLHDDNWKERQLKTFTFDIDQSQTIMVDQLSVRGFHWGRKIDMSKDPKMYSFSRPSYYLVLEFNPRQTSPFIQDKFGWSGEGMTDKKYLWVKKAPDPRPGESRQPDIRILRKVYRLSRAQIYGDAPVTEKDVVSNAEYDRIQSEQKAP
jgi:hypothetical protein